MGDTAVLVFVTTSLTDVLGLVSSPSMVKKMGCVREDGLI